MSCLATLPQARSLLSMVPRCDRLHVCCRPLIDKEEQRPHGIFPVRGLARALCQLPELLWALC